MKQQIESHKTFVDNVNGKPIKLLMIIKEYSLNYLANKYDIMIILDALQNLSLSGRKDKSLHDYKIRFTTTLEILELQMGGPMIITKLIQTNDDFDKDDDEGIRDIAKVQWQIFLAYIYMSNTDQQKYGLFLTRLQTQHNLGINNTYQPQKRHMRY